MQRTSTLIFATYPEVKKEWLREFLQGRFLRNEYDLEVTLGPGVKFRFEEGDSMLRIWGTFPNGRLGIMPSGVPPGVTAPKPIAKNVEDGQKIAEAVLVRLLSDAGNKTNLVVMHSGPYPRYEGVFVYQWRWNRKQTSAEIQVDLGEEDGQIKRVMVTPAPEDYLGEPKVTREQAIKMAQALPQRPKYYNESYLSLGCKWCYAERRLVWSYQPGPIPMVGSAGYAEWDAMTAELLLSDCVNGGTREKPYHNPIFYTTPGKEQLENAIKRWATEIEARNSPKDSHPLHLMPSTNAVPSVAIPDAATTNKPSQAK